MREVDDAINDDARAVMDACFAVHRTLGPGYAEAIYEEALGVELSCMGIPFVRQAPIALTYRGRTIGRHFVDVLVRDRLIVELKAVDQLAPVHHAQVISYLRTTSLELGLLVNFNVPLMRNGFRRVVLTTQDGQANAFP